MGDEDCRACFLAENARPVSIAQGALAAVGIDARTVFMTGFTDFSIDNNHGIEMAVLGIGAQNERSTSACISVVDMKNAVAMLHEIFRLTAG